MAEVALKDVSRNSVLAPNRSTLFDHRRIPLRDLFFELPKLYAGEAKGL